VHTLKMPGKRIGQHVRGALALMVLLGVAVACGYAQDARKPVQDADGNALPDGALKRLGSLRWRHGEPITFLAIPSDGKTLITATQDSVLRLWNRETGKEIRRFVPAADPNGMGAARVSPYLQGLTRAALSKNGKVLAVALPSNVVQLWDVDTGKPLGQIKSSVNGVGSMAFTPDGKTLALRGISDRICFLHESQTGKEIRKLKPAPPGGPGGNIFGGAGDGTGLAISPDGKIIALPELEFNNQRVSGSVTLFEIATGKEIRRFEAQSNGISAIAFSGVQHSHSDSHPGCRHGQGAPANQGLQRRQSDALCSRRPNAGRERPRPVGAALRRQIGQPRPHAR
jgi:WD40 repeat protein